VPAPGFWLPADPLVWFELDHVVIHLVVAEMGEVHLHHEDISHRRDHRGGDRSAQAFRAIEFLMPPRIGENLKDGPRRGADSSRYRNRPALIVTHEARFPSLGSRPWRPRCDAWR
jgi:hypothetical protein